MQNYVNFRQAIEYMLDKREPLSEVRQKDRKMINVNSEAYERAKVKLGRLLEEGKVEALGIYGKIIISYSEEEFPYGNYLKVITDEKRKSRHTIFTFYENCIDEEGREWTRNCPMDEIYYDINPRRRRKENWDKKIEKEALRTKIDSAFIRENPIDWAKDIIAPRIDNVFCDVDMTFETKGYAFVVLDFRSVCKKAFPTESKQKKEVRDKIIIKKAYQYVTEHPMLKNIQARTVAKEIKRELDVSKEITRVSVDTIQSVILKNVIDKTGKPLLSKGNVGRPPKNKKIENKVIEPRNYKSY